MSQVIAHIHNLKSKTLDFVWLDMRTQLRKELTPQRWALVSHCTTLQALIAEMRSQPVEHLCQEIKEAVDKCCAQKGLPPGFYYQINNLVQLNANRNQVEHCGVASSAAAVTAELETNLQPWQDVAGILVALAAVATKRTSEVETFAQQQLELIRKATAERFK